MYILSVCTESADQIDKCWLAQYLLVVLVQVKNFGKIICCVYFTYYFFSKPSLICLPQPLFFFLSLACFLPTINTNYCHLMPWEGHQMRVVGTICDNDMNGSLFIVLVKCDTVFFKTNIYKN